MIGQLVGSRSFQRLASNFGAQIFNQCVTIGVQILLVPVLLHAWGKEHYGTWLLLAAIPTYLTFSDFGFTFIAKNEMTMKVASGDRSGALTIYQSVFMLLNMVVVTVISLAVLLVFSIRIGGLFNLGDVDEQTAKMVLLILITTVIFYQYFLLFSGGMRSEGKPAEETSWNALGRLCEGVATGMTALLGGDLIAAAIAILINRLVFNAFLFLRLRGLASYLVLGWKHASREEIKRLFNPSVSYMFVSIAQALMIQGPVIVLGALGPVSQVVVFSTSRTLARLGTSASNILNFSVIPEYSRIYGLKEMERFLHFIKIHFALTIAGAITYVIIMETFGGIVMDYWTHDIVKAPQPFFTLLILSVFAEMVWSALFTPLTAVNQHISVSYSFATLSCIGIVLCYVLVQYFSLTGTAVALMSVHWGMIFVTGYALLQRYPRRPQTVVTQDSPSESIAR